MLSSEACLSMRKLTQFLAQVASTDKYTPAFHARSGILPPRLRHNYLLYCSILFSSRASFLETFWILKQLITGLEKPLSYSLKLFVEAELGCASNGL
jgi:hypothetical protein